MGRFLKRIPPLNLSAEVVSLMANKPEPKQDDDSAEVHTALLGRKISSLEGNRYAHYWSDPRQSRSQLRSVGLRHFIC